MSTTESIMDDASNRHCVFIQLLSCALDHLKRISVHILYMQSYHGLETLLRSQVLFHEIGKESAFE